MGTVPDLAELRKEMLGMEDRRYIIGDLFKIRQDNQGNFLIEDNRAMSV